MESKEARLLDKLQQRIEAKRAKRPHLAIVQAPPSRERFLDYVTRESHIKMIGHLRRRWGGNIQVIIDQACFGVGSVEALGDAELVALHRAMERASECLREGVSFEDAGLVVPQFASD